MGVARVVNVSCSLSHSTARFQNKKKLKEVVILYDGGSIFLSQMCFPNPLGVHMRG